MYSPIECTYAQELISAAVDGELADPDLSRLRGHLEHCQCCQEAYELEQAGKIFVKNNLPRVPLPAHVRQYLIDEIRRQTVVTGRRKKTWRVSLTLVATAAIVLLLVAIMPTTKSRHAHARPPDDNIIHQTYIGFDQLLSGVLVPEPIPGPPGNTEEYLTSKVMFTCSVPKPARYSLAGVMVSTDTRMPIAHIVYKKGNRFLYLREMNASLILSADDTSIPGHIRQELQRSGRYVEHCNSDCSLVVWLVDSTLYCAVGDLPADRLLAEFHLTN